MIQPSEVSLKATILAGGSDRGFRDGEGRQALLDRPVGVAVASTGQIIVVDTFNHRLRIVNPASGTTSTLAGSRKGMADGPAGEAMFHNPGAIAVHQPEGGEEELLIADTCNHAIRLVSFSSGEVQTLAGGSEGFRDGPLSEALFAFPEGIAVCPATGLIYIVDTDNNRIRVLDRVEGIVRTLSEASGSPPSLQHPEGIAVLPGGRLVIGDSCNHRLCMVDSTTGAICDLAGKLGEKGHIDGALEQARFDTPRGIAISRWGELIVADTNNDAVRVVDAGLTKIQTVCNKTRWHGAPFKAMRFDEPYAVAVSLSGDLVVTEFANDCVTLVANQMYVLKVELLQKSAALPPAVLRMLRNMDKF